MFYEKVVGIKKMLVKVNGGEVLGMGSWQVDDGGEGNEQDSILKTQLEVIILISGSGSDGNGSGKMSAPVSCSVGDEIGKCQLVLQVWKQILLFPCIT
ncbi:hypothetical protein MKX01_029000 [Papaver californicum]|nr:hypothetical protein MKX01_029000 [Papaver californicum]